MVGLKIYAYKSSNDIDVKFLDRHIFALEMDGRQQVDCGYVAPTAIKICRRVKAYLVRTPAGNQENIALNHRFKYYMNHRFKYYIDRILI